MNLDLGEDGSGMDEDDDMMDTDSPEESLRSFGTCIVCQEDLGSVSGSGNVGVGFGALGLIQPSRMLRNNPDGSTFYLNEALGAPACMDRRPVTDAVDSRFSPRDKDPRESTSTMGGKVNPPLPFDGFPGQHTRFGLHTSACSHLMHLECFQVYNASIKARHRTQGQRNHPESISRKEYICPLCKSLGNVILPVVLPSTTQLSTPTVGTPSSSSSSMQLGASSGGTANSGPATSIGSIKFSSGAFSDWIRSAGITILKSKPDPQMDALQFKMGTGEFVFWSAQDPAYVSFSRNPVSTTATPSDNNPTNAFGINSALASSANSVNTIGGGNAGGGDSAGASADAYKMLDTLMVVCKSFSQQTRHLRDRMEPEMGDRGAGLYLPEDLVGYTVGCLEVSLRGSGVPGDSTGTLVVDQLSESTTQMIRGLVNSLTRLAALSLRSRPDEGRGAIKQAIIKRLLPEWSRSSLTSLSSPLLLRDPLTILVETAAVAPEMLRHVLVLLYHVCLARTVIGLVYVLNKSRAAAALPLSQRSHPRIFGDVRMFCMSVVRHSPVFEHTADVVFEAFGEARVEKLLYSFTLPFLRRAAILCRAVLPSSFPTPDFISAAGEPELSEYERLLRMLSIPSLADLPNQDTLQTALAGWCSHYGHSHAASSLNCGVALDYPSIYRIARLPHVLDTLFSDEEKAMVCGRCKTAPTDAAICLLCGTICCMQSHCCRDLDARERGECNMHTRESVFRAVVFSSSKQEILMTA